MKFLFALAALVFTSPVFADTQLTPTQEKEAKAAWDELEVNVDHCQMGTLYDGGPSLTEDEIRTACARYDEAVKTLAGLGIAAKADFFLPRNSAGIWSGATNGGFLDMNPDGSFYYSTEKDGGNQFDCRITAQIGQMYGYSVDCKNKNGLGLFRGQMRFYEEGTMGFDETRFTYGDCPKGCPE